MAPVVSGLFDTHCHLDAAEFDDDRKEVVAAAVRAGVTAMLVPAVEVANFAQVRDLCAPNRPDDLQRISLLAAFGIHPMYTAQAKDEDIATLRHWLRTETATAVGEIGLDGYVPDLDMARQEWFFVEQLKLAREFDLPVILHLRRAQDLVLKHLRRIGVRGGIAHAFNGSRQQADVFIKLGFKLGFGGAMTFAGSTRIRALARELPLESIVLETDAPDIPPSWLGRDRNTPAQLVAIASCLAELRYGASDAEKIADIARRTATNARQLLCLEAA